jgi:hypothetical protein
MAPNWRRMKEQTRCSTIDIAGVEQFEYARAVHRATPGEVILLTAGTSAYRTRFDERGFGFRMLYVPESTFREIAPPPSFF